MADAILIAQTLAAQGAAAGWLGGAPDGRISRLHAKAFPNTPDPAPPPVDATLTRVDYELRVGEQTVTGQARLAIDVLKQGWATVLVPAGMLVRNATTDGRPTTLVQGTPPKVLLSRAGRSTLTLDVVVPLSSTAGTESIALPPSSAALSSVTLVVPVPGVAQRERGIHRRRNQTAGESRWVVYGNPDVRCRLVGGARRTTGEPPCRCGHARGSSSSSRSARTPRR